MLHNDKFSHYTICDKSVCDKSVPSSCSSLCAPRCASKNREHEIRTYFSRQTPAANPSTTKLNSPTTKLPPLIQTATHARTALQSLPSQRTITDTGRMPKTRGRHVLVALVRFSVADGRAFPSFSRYSGTRFFHIFFATTIIYVAKNREIGCCFAV